MVKHRLIVLLSLLSGPVLQAQQTCTIPGQTPVSAIPVCGSEPFTINTPSYCGATPVPVPCPASFPYQNSNPNYFRMACYSAGTLGFIITPDMAAANYDWQLFDISSRNPYDIFTEPSLFVACNWSAEPGETGTSPDGIDTIVCAGSGQAVFSRMPQILQGHTYLLMVCNQNASPGNYQLTFTGGTASITDDIEPRMDYAGISCDGSKIMLRLNKKVRCSSIAPDGSDFSLGNGLTILSATPADCSSVFGSDSIYILLAQPLPNGLYSLQVNTGSDGNSLLDICSKAIPDGQSIPLTVSDQQQTVLQQAAVNPCSPDSAELLFSKPVRCSSISPDGSQFLISGPQGASITRATGTTCINNPVTQKIRVRFNAVLLIPGTYQVQLNPGAGSPLVDECNVPLSTASAVFFTSFPGVSADFTYSIEESCQDSRYSFFHNGNNGVNSWNWAFGNTGSSVLQNPVQLFTGAGQHTIRLDVSNGSCTDRVEKTIVQSAGIAAAFETDAVLCPGDTLHILNKSTGSIDRWDWDFGNGLTSSLPQPRSVQYGPVSRETVYSIKLTVTNNRLNCSDTARRSVRVLSSCIIAVPTAFSPNGDGLNDFLFPLNSERMEQLQFSIYNRAGQLLFQTRGQGGKWDGRVKGQLQEPGIYVWVLSYTQPGTLRKILLRGISMLVR
ncbi:MAG: gliding motility-associated C-terminal domain-containing protein [Sphingobacteriales bacterium]|nr:gliding motility-associated C-terminal domain-containing protein [Sphingobacteriales bacterium]